MTTSGNALREGAHISDAADAIVESSAAGHVEKILHHLEKRRRHFHRGHHLAEAGDGERPVADATGEGLPVEVEIDGQAVDLEGEVVAVDQA